MFYNTEKEKKGKQRATRNILQGRHKVSNTAILALKGTSARPLAGTITQTMTVAMHSSSSW